MTGGGAKLPVEGLLEGRVAGVRARCLHEVRLVHLPPASYQPVFYVPQPVCMHPSQSLRAAVCLHAPQSVSTLKALTGVTIGYHPP